MAHRYRRSLQSSQELLIRNRFLTMDNDVCLWRTINISARQRYPQLLSLFNTRQAAVGIEYYNAPGTAGLFVDPGIARSNRRFATFLQYLIFAGAVSPATTNDVCPAAHGISESGFWHEGP